MSRLKTKNRNIAVRQSGFCAAMLLFLIAETASAAVPGITGALSGSTVSFSLDAAAGFLSQPDGAQIYSWGFGCNGTPAGFAPFSGTCTPMQVPGPTLIVTEGQTVSVTLKNNLPAAAGSTSILFPGFNVTATGGSQGVLTSEAAAGGSVTYTFVASTPGTHSYYSGTQGDLQIEMGLYGALVVLPSTPPATCRPVGNAGTTDDYRLAPSAYDHATTCYDREYLFQFAELDPRIHRQAERQALSPAGSTLNIVTEPYHPAYFLINGRSMPDDMDANYAPNYPNQPYNGNPHMHPGELVLMRVIGQGRWQHPFHEHANHTRILGRDGNLILSQTDATKLGGRMEFTTDTTPGQAFDGIFQYTGKGLNWDIYGHTPTATPTLTCTADLNGYFTTASGATRPTYTNGVLTGGSPNYYEWCADHNHPLESKPAGTVGAGGPATLPDPLIAANGLWYNGTPYLGKDAVVRSSGPTPLPPGGALQNPLAESGIAFMWHSHNEREITTNDVFPGGMLMMMLVDPWDFFIDETL